MAAAVEVDGRPFCHLGLGREPFEIVIFRLALKSHDVLVDGQQSELVCGDSHDVRRMGVHNRVDVASRLQHFSMQDRRAALARRRIRRCHHVTVEVVLDN